jgi:hypothetical protein
VDGVEGEATGLIGSFGKEMCLKCHEKIPIEPRDRHDVGKARTLDRPCYKPGGTPHRIHSMTPARHPVRDANKKGESGWTRLGGET